MVQLEQMGKQARQAARELALASTLQKNSFLNDLAYRLIQATPIIVRENAKDVEAARQAGLSEALVDRLVLNPRRLETMASDILSIVELPDPVGERFDELNLPNGLKTHKQRVPVGVLAVIYESRPNVTVDVSCLAIKSGNAVILRGGSETIRSNAALVQLIQESLQTAGLSPDSVQFIDDPDRQLVYQLLKMYESVDMVIPRGGAGLHKFCRENSMIPVIVGGIGICHLFVDETVDLERVLPVIFNAKVQRPSVCNALDTILVHLDVAARLLSGIVDSLGKAGVSFKAEPWAYEILTGQNCLAGVEPAGPDDFDTEWLSLVLGLKIVSSRDEAIAHIAAHSTGHSDGILTASESAAADFVRRVDSAAVYVNASTRFTDGSQLGLGAEVAISTQRLHARGPMALRELTTYKWVVLGDMHVRP